MKAFHIDAATGLDGLVLREAPVPRPGRGEALIRVHARSLNYRDHLILKGAYPVPVVPGVVALSDGAGEVVEIGPEVTHVAVGDRVMATYFPQWIDGRFAMRFAAEQFGCTRDGMLASFVTASEASLVKIPPHLSYEEAAALPCAALTAWSALVGPRPIIPGETVMTIGTGSVALFALQFAKLFGARVIALTSKQDKTGRLTELGAHDVINYGSTPDWSSTVREVTDGRGVDHVVETGSLGTFTQSVASTAEEGVVNLVAALGNGTVDVQMFRNAVTIRRIYVGSRASFETMSRAITAHGLRPVVDRVFAFGEAKEAFRYSEARRQFGKVVIAGD